MGYDFGDDQEDRKAGNARSERFLCVFLLALEGESAIGMRDERAEPGHGERYKA